MLASNWRWLSALAILAAIGSSVHAQPEQVPAPYPPSQTIRQIIWAPSDSASFPTKWMSADGKTLYLVFSGDDNFCLRRAQLELPGQ